MNVLRRSVRRRVFERLRRSATHSTAAVAALAVSFSVLGAVSASPAAAAPEDGTLKVLLFYKPNFHASHVQARQAVKDLANELGTQYSQPVEIEETDNAGAFTEANLATKDAVVFAQTGGVLFNDAQRTALEDYIRGGGGYMGLHYAGWSVGQSEHDVNPFYAELVGAVSEGHPENPAVRSGRVVVKDAAHPLAQGLPAEVTRSDEWYDWLANPAEDVRTIVEVDESSYNSLGRQGTTHPVTWCQEIDGGRSWYSGMGHEGSAYSEPFIRTQMRNGLAYAAGLLPADCSPPSKEENGSWSGVTPWPVMPINMALTSDGTVQSFGGTGGRGGDPTPYDWTGDSTVYQGGQVEIDVWDPAEERTLANLRTGIIENATYSDLFCSMQVQNPHNGSTLTVGGDDGLGENAPNDGTAGVTSYTTNNGLQNEAPMHFARWYPTGTTMPDGSIVVQGGSLRGGPGGPGVQTPEIYTPDEGSGWKLLKGAKSAVAYSQNENRWWYPRAFVAPGDGDLFNISGTQMFELDPEGNGGEGELTLRGTLPAGIGNQGDLGNPVGATSTAVMYRPGKILQVGGGWWANGGGPAGARAGFTVDITGGTENPVLAATEPMKYQRHWANSTIMPDGNVIVTGGSRQNADNGGYVTNAEIWNPDTGKWTTVEVPYEHARLYHSTALLLPDGRIMIGGGGAPGPRNYTDVEYYSPAYLFDGDEPAERPEITDAPGKIGYDGTFGIEASGPVSRVTLVRNGSVTHSFNNDQNFQDLQFSQAAGSGEVTISAPQDATYAPPGSYMLFVFDEDGTPSVAKILDIDPEVAMDSRTPEVVEMFEYPRFPADGTQVVDVAPSSARMAPWAVDSQVQLVRAIASSQGGLGATGYHLALGAAGSLERTVKGLDAGRDYRISLRYARDSRSAAGLGAANAQLSIGSLDTTLTAGTDLPSQGNGLDQVFGKYVGTFTADRRSETLRLAAGEGDAGMMIDDLVITAVDPGVSDVPVHYEFEEGEGTTAANTGTDDTVGAATLTGTTGWSEDGVFGSALDLPGGENANAVDLPDNLLQGEENFSTSMWVRPDTKGNWINLFHIGDGTGDGNAASFFQIQMQTQAQGNTGLAATFKGEGAPLQERVYATPTRDVTAGQWNHVAFTREGTTGTLYLNGEPIATKNNFTIDMTDVGPTANNWLGRNGFPDPAFDGRMDEVRVYDSTLSATDVAGLYEEGAALRTTTTVTADPASPSPFAEPIAFTASVDGEDGEDAEGTVTLWVDGSAVGSAETLVDGTATFPEITLNRGDHEVEVRFTAAEGWRDSSVTTQHTVERPAPGSGVPVRYAFDEGSGATSANVGTDASIGAATLQGATGWTQEGRFGPAVSLPGGGSATGNQVKLPDNIQAGMTDEFSVSVWARPDALPNWVPLVQIGSSTDTFFLLQSSTQAAGATGFAATFKAPGNPTQERLTLGGGNDLPLNEWTHVVYTHSGTTGRIYFDGELQAQRDNFTLDMGDVGVGGNTTANMIGGTSWPDPRFDGLVDEFQMFGYELTEEQIAELHEGPEPANTAPVGAEDTYSTDEGTALTVEAPGVLANDTDVEEDTLTATGATQPDHGAVSLEADGSFTYTPDAGFTGTDSFTYTAHDGTTASEATTVTITVNEVEDPPATTTVTGSAAAVTYGKAGTVTVTVDPEAATGTVQVLDGTTSLGSATLANGTASVALPAKSLQPGTHRLTVQYSGDEAHTAATSTVDVRVDKVKPSIKVKAPKKVKKGKRASVKVVLQAADGVPVTGKVTLTVKGGVKGTKKITATVKNGKVKVTLPKATKTGTMKIKAVYLGSDLAVKVVKKTTVKVTK